MKRSARPNLDGGTAGSILSTARELFACNGIHRTTIRSVAVKAGVDPALVHYYFGSRRQLIAAAVGSAIDPESLVAVLSTTPVDELGWQVPLMLLSHWDSEAGPAMTAALRYVRGGPGAGPMDLLLRDTLIPGLASKIESRYGAGIMRAELAVAELLGVAMMRYVLKAPPITALTFEHVADLIAPNIQRYLTGEIPITAAAYACIVVRSC
jgi:AcrR family transcriptional regulator